MDDPSDLPFASRFDRELFERGPPAIFTLDPRGELRVDPERTREIHLLTSDLDGREVGSFVLRDRKTGVLMAMLVTHPAMATLQPRADVERLESWAAASARARAQWRAPPAHALDADGGPDARGDEAHGPPHRAG